MSAEPNEEQSIKARARLIYDDEPLVSGSSTPRKPFSEYLRETPPTPLSPLLKGLLYALGILVTLLLIGALVKGPKPKPATKTPARKSSRAPLQPPHIIIVSDLA